MSRERRAVGSKRAQRQRRQTGSRRAAPSAKRSTSSRRTDGSTDGAWYPFEDKSRGVSDRAKAFVAGRIRAEKCWPTSVTITARPDPKRLGRFKGQAVNDKATKLDIFVYPPPERAYPHVSQHQGGKGGITLNDLDEMFVMTACHELYHAMSYKRTLDAGTEPKADDYGFAALRAYRRGGK